MGAPSLAAWTRLRGRARARASTRRSGRCRRRRRSAAWSRRSTRAAALGILRPGKRDPRLAAPARCASSTCACSTRGDSGDAQAEWLSLGPLARLAWAKERRVCQAVRLSDGTRSLLVANLHATSYPPDERLADAELLRAFVYVDGLAEPGEPIAVAGDFNVTFERSRTLLDVTSEEWGFSRAGPGSTTCSCAASRSRPARRAGSRSAASTTARSSPITRRSTWSSHDASTRPGRCFRCSSASHTSTPARSDRSRGRRRTSIAEQLRRDVEHGRSGKPYIEEMQSARATLRELVARPARRRRRSRSSLTYSTTDGCNIVLGRSRPAARGRDRHDRRGALRPRGAGLRIGRHGARRAGAGARRRTRRSRRSSPRSRRGRACSPSRTSSGRRASCSTSTRSRSAPACRFSSTARSRSARSRSRSARSTTTRCRDRSGSAGRTRRARSTSPTSRRCASRGPSYFAQESFEPGGRYVPREGAQRFDPGWLSVASLKGLATAIGARAGVALRADPRDRRALPRGARGTRAGRHAAGPGGPRHVPSRRRPRRRRGAPVRAGRRRAQHARDAVGARVVRLVDERRRRRAASRRSMTSAGRARRRSAAARRRRCGCARRARCRAPPRPVDLVAVHAGGERRLLELLPHRLRLQPLEPGRPHEPARVDEAAQLVAREQRLLQQRVARQREVLRVREHGLDDLLRIALLAQDRRAVLRMLVERRMDLVVEVVEQRGDAPELLVLAELAARRTASTPRRRAHAEAATRSSCSASASPRPGHVSDPRAGVG